MRRARADRRATGAAAAEDAVAEADLVDPNPDVQELFRHYDRLYFQGTLGAADFTVKWGSSTVSSSFGSCTFSKPSNTITLYEPVLRYRSCTDLKKALLHEMIHAIIYVKHPSRNCSTHGPLFRDWMDAINSCSINDPQRPVSGYNITTLHDFKPERPFSFKGCPVEVNNLVCPITASQCESCGDSLPRATNMGPPSDACCIENVDHDATCGNMLCHWHNHKSECGGSYESMGLQSVMPVQKKVQKGTQFLLTYPSEESKSKGTIQESYSAEQNAEDEHLPLRSYMNAVKRHRSEVVQKAIVTAVEPPKEVKEEQDLVAMEKHEHLSPVGCNDKTGKRPRSEVVDAEDILPDEPPKEMKQALIAVEEHELFSPGGYNDATSHGDDPSKKFSMQHRPEDIQPATPQGKPKLKQNLVPTETHNFFSIEDCNNAKTLGNTDAKKASKQHKPEGVQRPSDLLAASQGGPKVMSREACDYSTSKQADEQKAFSQHAYPLRRLKKDLVAPQKNELCHLTGCSHEKLLDKNLSKKTQKRHEPENIQETTMLPTVLRHKESSFVASQKQKRKCRRQPARKKEYAVMSAWMNIYESDRSSGSTEPLVNKRTVRRKRERERIQAYSRSNKKVNLDNSRIDVSVSSHKSGKDESALESRPPSPCSNAIVPITAQQVVTQGGHSQAPAPCWDIVPLQPADAPLPLDFAIIDISDDE
ncbi:hypothetical protein PR202_ga15886 [Eleusine coracana subsp. coracana]|uniref:SprT-like domain-containing protein n=1 Tax=Eleusine coracana subsp. coracana TaxID=191504 RepID=A0AAV5CLM3_ELECO|nr:hypothetical protein PR202_ga15886 [Eleusine coracana subsp. coracana]